MTGPRADVVIRRFLEGYSIDGIALETTVSKHFTWHWDARDHVEATIRRRLNRLARKGKKR